MSDSVLKDLEKKVNGDLRKAQNNMFSGKNEEAWNMIEEIWTDLEKIRTIDPNYRTIQNMERTYNKLKQDLEKKLGKGQTTSPTPVKALTPSTTSIPTQQRPTLAPAPKEIDPNKLPAGVTKRLGDIQTPLERVETYTNETDSLSKIDKARYELQSATSIYEEITRMYSDYANHPDVESSHIKITQLTEKLAALSEKAEAEKEQAEKIKEQIEAESRRWVEKIRPYLLSSGVHDKQLELSRIRGKENLLHQTQLLEEVKALQSEYNSQDWSNGKTWDLEQAEENLLKMIKNGEETYHESITSIINEAASLIEEKINWFNSDTAWRTDNTKRPAWLYTRDREAIDEKMAIVNELVPEILAENSQDLLDLKNKRAKLMELNQERLDIIPQRTYMVPEKYAGDDKDALKTKAAELVKDKEPTADILRVHLIREDWRVEDVLEHTDTSRTAIRHRITYHLPAQVAAKVGENTLLYNAHIAKNQRPDGSFDGLYGNLEDHPDTITPENIQNKGTK
ncbi:hypothetical protein E4H04_03800 [Candidatus Bathyarchaeota archaeon]|nr:MAG: hypothetical protein E4H04_03800 [Candidatus Bathyarchaeota archaeon]